jgi:tetratricopeptide (TPR) repeat protein
MKSDLIENRQIRIFISSTFRDMHAERDYLVQRVFPSLRRYCEERDVSLQELDLRWGISEEESKQGKVVDICLKEIQNTTPFFIGLLGERYGWVPDGDERVKIADTTSVFQEYPWVNDELQKGTSITEIEIQEGVLRSKEHGEEINAYFYFRSSAAKVEIPEDYRLEDFREEPDSEGERKLRQLKQTLREQETYPVSDYDDLEQLGKLVEQDFKTLIDKLFPQGALSEMEMERLQQRIFLKRMNAVYVPIPEYEKLLTDLAAEAAPGHVIWGDPGTGKSALLAHWIQNRGERKNEKIIYHFIGQSKAEGDYRKIIRRIIEEIKDLYKFSPEPESEQLGSDDDRLKKELENLLFAIWSPQSLIIILDGVDKLTGDGAKSLNWLPIIPDTVKFIFSTQTDDPTMDYFARMKYSGLIVKAPDLECRKTLIEKYLASFGKKLTPLQIERIASDKENENPLALRTLLDELRVFGKYEELDTRINEYLQAGSISELFTLMLERCEKTYNYSVGNFVKEALALLYVAQRGLTETEIRVFTGENGKETPYLYWSQLFCGIASHLAVRGGMVTLSHGFIREAVKSRYLSDDAAVRECRMKLVESMNDPDIDILPNRKYDEIAHQLLERADWDALYRLLLDFKIFRYLSTQELVKYWQPLLRVDRNKYAIEQFLELDTQGRTPAKMAELFQTLSSLAGKLEDHSLAVTFADKAIQYGTTNASVYFTRGYANYDKKDYDSAIADYSKVIQLNPKDYAAFNNRGLAYMDGKKDYNRAIADYSEAIRLDPKYPRALYNRGNAYKNGKKDYDRAIADYTEAIRFNPNVAVYYYNRGEAYMNGKIDYDQAIEDYTKALLINPQCPGAAGLQVAQNAKNTFDRSLTQMFYSGTTIVFSLIIMAAVSYAADRIDKGWLHSLAIICNVVGIVWLAKTIITGVLKRIRQTHARQLLFFKIFPALAILTVVLDIGLSIHFVKNRATGNPVSVVLQNPFEAARKRFFGAGKDDKTDMRADILPPDPVEDK